MEFDRSQLEKLLSLDDESFKALTRTIADAAGANKLKTEAMLNNPDLLKRKIAQMSPEEAQMLINSVDREKSVEIMNMLKGRGVDFGR